MDNSVASVDTLVYQLEDDDASVRWTTLQRLRKRAAVERAQLPVRNPRRFLQCLRRRLTDDDPRIARETLRLLRDVVDVLRADVELILSSVLPHLVSRLSARHGHAPTSHHAHDDDDETTESPLDEDAYAVFRKYVNATNDLAAVANLLVNMGLAHGRPHVREAALLALVRLLDERYAGRRRGGDNITTGTKGGGVRVDAALFTELVQAAVPALEDSDERVVVAAEEVIAKLQLYWGHTGFQEATTSYLSSEDKATLETHAATIRAFADAAANGGGAPVSVSASQVLALRASLPVANYAHIATSTTTTVTATALRFGFVASDVVDALNDNRGHSNVEWKKRTAAVEQLYAAAKHVDARVLVAHATRGADASMGSLMELLEMLLRLLHDIDVHLVKRSLQILRLVFYKLEPTHNDDEEEEDDHDGPSPFMERVLPALVETAANYVDDDELTAHTYTLLQTLFTGPTARVATFTHALLSSLSHRRLQVREEALKIWIVLVLTTEQIQATATTKRVTLDATVVDALGRALGDGSARVRAMAVELAAVLTRATRQDVCAIVESQVDDYTLERIDVDALYARVRDKKLPTLLANGQLQLRLPPKETTSKCGESGAVKATHTRSPVRTSGVSNTAPERTTTTSSMPDGPSELRQLEPRDRGSGTATRASAVVRASTTRRDPVDAGSRPTAIDPYTSIHRDGRSDSANPTRASHAVVAPRDVSSAPGEPIVDKLQALKRKTELLKKSASSKHVVYPPASTNRPFNPQEGESEFASAGYAAQQQRPAPTPAKSLAPPRQTAKCQPPRQDMNDAQYEDELEDEDENKPRRFPQAHHASTAFTTPREDTERVATRRAKPPPPADDDYGAVALDDRPIRPMRDVNLDEFAANDSTYEDDTAVVVAKKTRPAVPISLATKKRLEAKQRQEQQEQQDAKGADWGDVDYAAEPSPEKAAPKPLSLATRKRQGQASNDVTTNAAASETKPLKRSALAGGGATGGSGAPPPSFGKQEPRYLESHEVLPLKDAKQDAAKVASLLRSDNWEVVFEALSTVRRLAMHHTKLLDDKLHAVVTEILKQVPNLRSSVAKNALLALDALVTSLGKQLDSELEAIVPVLLRRCTDSNTFVCESTSQSIHVLITYCSTARVVVALAGHATNRAIAIRREVARSMHAVVVALADQAPLAKEFPSILSVVGKCLDDSHNEVRDAAKQSVVYLHHELGLDGERIKKLLPASVHSKVDPLLRTQRAMAGGGSGSGSGTNRASTNPRETVAMATKPAAASAPPATKSGATAPPAATAPRRASTTAANSALDNEALAALARQLESSNWKDRFDALSETAAFIARYRIALCESGKLLTLFDGLLKRMDDGNAKVATLALELLPTIIASLGDGMELVLQTFVPVVAKTLAANNARQAALAHAVLQALCVHVDARLLCQHLAAVARHANARVKPALIDVLDGLVATMHDEKYQFALTRYVLPLALELLKEGKSDVKDITARLLRSLYSVLGASVTQAATKLSGAQQDKLTAILAVRGNR